MKMNDAVPRRDPREQEILHEHTQVRITTHPPWVVQTQHLKLEVPTYEAGVES
jgi:hypothetical protein